MIPFVDRKQQILSAMVTDDLSPKGSVDERAWPIIDLLNSLDSYCTTSSCSGRVSILLHSDPFISQPVEEQDSSSAASKKKGGEWLFVSHEQVNATDERENIFNKFTKCHECPKMLTEGPLIYFKVEAFILHVEAADLDSARTLVDVAMQTGYRNSGILTSSKRHMVAFRHTMRIDAPIGHRCPHGLNVLWVDFEHLNSLFDLASIKLNENFDRMNLLLESLRSKFAFKEHVETKEERWARKREQGLQRKTNKQKEDTDNVGA